MSQPIYEKKIISDEDFAISSRVYITREVLLQLSEMFQTDSELKNNPKVDVLLCEVSKDLKETIEKLIITKKNKYLEKIDFFLIACIGFNGFKKCLSEFYKEKGRVLEPHHLKNMEEEPMSRGQIKRRFSLKDLYLSSSLST